MCSECKSSGRKNMQITPINNLFNNLTPIKSCDNKFNSVQKRPLQSVETAGTVGIATSEILGRSMVNFCGIKNKPEYKLTESDNNFAECVGKIYRLNDDEVKSVKNVIGNFLNKNNFKKISDMQSDDIFEFANESAYLTEKLSNMLNLSDFEDTTLTFLITAQINEGDISELCTRDGKTIVEDNKYTKDFTPIEGILNRADIDDFDTISGIHRHLAEIASKKDYDSIFEMFTPKNAGVGRSALDKFSGELGKDKVIDIFLDFVELAPKSDEERIEGLNIKKERERIEDGVQVCAIAYNISKKFGIEVDERLLELLDSRKTDTELHKDGKSDIEVAYRISDEYNLPENSTDEILKIIEKHKVWAQKRRYDDFFDAIS